MRNKKSAPTQKQNKMIQAALQLHQSGQLELAQSHYQKLIGEMPNNTGLITNLAMIKMHQGKLEEGVKLLSRSLAIDPRQAETLNHQGSALKALGRFQEALEAFDGAIALQPSSFFAHSNRGNALQSLNRFEEAIESYDRAIALKYDYVEAYYNKASALDALKESEKAVENYSKAIAINPKFFQAYGNRGNALRDLGKFEQAVADYNQAVALNPNYAQAHYNKGNVLKELGRFDEVVESYDKAIKIIPNLIQAHFNRANILREMKRMEEALVGYDNVIALQPKHANAHYNRGNALKDIKMLEKAVKSYEQTTHIKPDHADAYYNCGNVLRSLGRLEDALKQYEQAINIQPNPDFVLGVSLFTKMHLCIWDNLDQLKADLLAKVEKKERVIIPFASLVLMDDPAMQKKIAEIFAQTYLQKDPENGTALSKIKAHPNQGKIRIGYFSADFRNHPVSFLTAELYELHDRENFEIHAFSLAHDNGDEMNQRIKSAVDHYHNVCNASNEEIVALARSLQIDIAVDLGGYTQDSRTKIFALQTAPVQVSYIGYLGTMGLNYYDYLIADETLVPKQEQQFYSEKIVYLPCWQVNDSNKELPTKTVTRKEFGLPETGFVFCCFNNTYKITPDVFDSWARILKAVQGSVLFIYANHPTAKANLIKEITKRGIDASRLIFGETLGKLDYLARFKAADLFLDTFPYNAGTTASDALQMGLPLITFKGKTFSGKAAASVLTGANLPELIAENKEEYESLAIHLAQNPEKLKTIKEKITTTLLTTPLYDSKTFTKTIQSAYKTMHENAKKNLPPHHIY